MKTHASKEAEAGLIGSVFQDNAAMDEVCSLVDADSFAVAANADIWRIAVSLRLTGQLIDPVSICEALGTAEALANVGGASYLATLAGSGGDIKHAIGCAKVIRRHAITRKVIASCQEIISAADSRAMKPEELLDHAERTIFDMGQGSQADSAVSHAQVVEDSLLILERRVSQFREGKTTGALSYGLVELDRVTAGMHPGELIIIAARPGVGKTIMGCHLADVAASAGAPALFVALEQARTELALRLLAKHAGVNAFKIRGGTVTDQEFTSLVDATDRVRNFPIWWDDTPSQTVWRIASQARRLKAKRGLQLLVVDYMQLIEAANRKQKRHEQVGEMSRGLKMLARDLNIPVVCMAQLNREVENRGGEPKLSDLRESGDIEQNADTVIFLHPQGVPDMNGVPTKTQEIKLLIRKQRNGPITDVTVIHDKPHYALRNFAIDHARDFA